MKVRESIIKRGKRADPESAGLKLVTESPPCGNRWWRWILLGRWVLTPWRRLLATPTTIRARPITSTTTHVLTTPATMTPLLPSVSPFAPPVDGVLSVWEKQVGGAWLIPSIETLQLSLELTVSKIAWVKQVKSSQLMTISGVGLRWATCIPSLSCSLSFLPSL